MSDTCEEIKPDAYAVKSALVTLAAAGWDLSTGLCARNLRAVRITVRSPDIEVEPECDMNKLIDVLMGDEP